MVCSSLRHPQRPEAAGSVNSAVVRGETMNIAVVRALLGKGGGGLIETMYETPAEDLKAAFVLVSWEGSCVEIGAQGVGRVRTRTCNEATSPFGLNIDFKYKKNYKSLPQRTTKQRKCSAKLVGPC